MLGPPLFIGDKVLYGKLIGTIFWLGKCPLHGQKMVAGLCNVRLFFKKRHFVIPSNYRIPMRWLNK